MSLLWASTLIAQTNNYYWADNSRMAITASKTHFIVTADSPSTVAGLKPQTVKSYVGWNHKPYAVVEANGALTTAQLIAKLGFDTDEVSVSPGYALSDGFVIYPTRTVVAQLIDKDDKVALERLAERFGAKVITKKFGTYRIELADVN
ncbi:MAG: hypothetical protein AAF597_11975, partial [Bacteroidota bacterium]